MRKICIITATALLASCGSQTNGNGNAPESKPTIPISQIDLKRPIGPRPAGKPDMEEMMFQKQRAENDKRQAAKAGTPAPAVGVAAAAPQPSAPPGPSININIVRQIIKCENDRAMKMSPPMPKEELRSRVHEAISKGQAGLDACRKG